MAIPSLVQNPQATDFLEKAITSLYTVRMLYKKVKQIIVISWDAT